MNISTTIRRFTTLGLTALLSAGIVTSAYAAPGTIASSPLFLTNYPQPNIFFMLDDSGSMDWDVMVNSAAEGLPNMGGWTGNYYVLPAWNNNYDSDNNGPNSYIFSSSTCTASGRMGCFPWVTPSEAELPNNSWRVRNHHYNSIYYNPAVTYKPWAGVDASGNPLYSNVSATAAPVDPGHTGQGTLNLTSTINYYGYAPSKGGWYLASIFPAHYFIWSDSNSDGVVDGNDTHTMVQIVPTVTTYATSATRTDCAAAPTCSYAEEIQNFANWFSYHRKREYVAKSVISKLVSESQVRMGMSTIWNNNSVGTPIADIDDITAPVDATAKANKANLLGQLANINSWLGTPLRLALRNVGNYFEGVSTGVSSVFGTLPNPLSPILPASQGGQCQQNFTILMSDGFWNGNTPNVGDTDSDNSSAFDGQSYADGVSNTLADVAMHYYERDLSTTLANDVPVTPGVDDNNMQHMVTYAVAFGLSGNASCNPASRTDSVESQGWPEVCSNPSFAGIGSGWPDPTDASDLDRVDDMRHAAWNGRGLFLSANDPQSLDTAMQNAISDIADKTGSAAAVSFNSTSLQTDSLVYQAKFDSGGWHGDLRAVELISSGGVVSLGSEKWKAGALLDIRNLVTNPREIVTYNGTAGIAFEWPADYNSPTTSELSANQINDLLANAPFPTSTTTAAEIAANETFGSNIVDYLSGHHTNEGSSSSDFRDRNGHRLGDIVHSGPFYVGPPSAQYPNLIEGASHPYKAFVNTWANRKGRVYVGANDGMLHVFDSNGGTAAGQEVFAYIPGFLFSADSGDGLHHQAEQGYVHDYQVDLSPVVRDVFIGSDWKTYLVGGVRGGGKGIFVLDVTDPDMLNVAHADDVVKMEYTHPDLGYTFSDIQVGKMNNGKWAAVFGNGYNNTGTGSAKLFIVYLDGTTPPDIIDTKVGTIAGGDCNNALSDCNGLSTPAIADINGDGIVDRIYAGDLKGNMWVFNVHLDGGTWNPRPAYGSTTAPKPLFVACEGASTCSASNRQPITSKPALARHPTQSAASSYPNIMVYFGTGQYIVSADNSTTQLQEFYGVWDRGDEELKSSDLVKQTITTTTKIVGAGTVDVRTMSDNAVNYVASSTATDHGWRIELPTSMERNVVAPVVIEEITFFNTMIPETGVCTQGGYSWLMAVDMATGGLPGFVVLDVNNDGLFDSDDDVGGIVVSGVKSGGISTDSKFLPTGGGGLVRVTSDSTGGISVDGVKTGSGDPAGRMSWTLLEY